MKKFLFIIFASSIFAEEPFVFKNIRSMGMGGILLQNPAILGEFNQKIINFGTSYQNYSWHVELPDSPDGWDLFLSHIGGSISYTQQNLCVSSIHWQRGDNKTENIATDEEGEVIDTFKDLSYETSLLLGIGKKISQSFSIGVNIKYLTTKTEFDEILKKVKLFPLLKYRKAIAFDAGVLFNPTPKIKIICSFDNVFSAPINYIVFDDWGYTYNVAQELPKNLSFGANFHPNNKILFGILFSHLLEEKVKCKEEDYQFKRTIGIGIEFIPFSYLLLRSGIIKTTVPTYRGFYRDSSGNFKYYYYYVKRTIPTIGVGFRYKHIEINFAGIFEDRKKDIKKITTVTSVTSTFIYMLGATYRF